MWFDTSNPVVALCAEGMPVEGEAAGRVESLAPRTADVG